MSTYGSMMIDIYRLVDLKRQCLRTDVIKALSPRYRTDNIRASIERAVKAGLIYVQPDFYGVDTLRPTSYEALPVDALVAYVRELCRGRRAVPPTLARVAYRRIMDLPAGDTRSRYLTIWRDYYVRSQSRKSLAY